MSALLLAPGGKLVVRWEPSIRFVNGSMPGMIVAAGVMTATLLDDGDGLLGPRDVFRLETAGTQYSLEGMLLCVYWTSGDSCAKL